MKTLGAFLAALSLLACAQTLADISGPLDDALARGDWTAVKGLIGPTEQGREVGRDVILGYAALLTGDYAGATTVFSRASMAPLHRVQRALDAAESFVRRHPGSWAGHLVQADLLARAGKYDQALAAASRAIDLNPRAAIGYDLRGTIHALAGQDDAALADLDQATQIDPQFADAYAARGIVRLHQAEPAKAQEEVGRALHLEPALAVAANVRGVALCQQQQYEEALQAFAFALDLQPDFTAAATNMETAKFLSTPERMRTRIAIISGPRAGALGRRTVALVLVEQDRAEEAGHAVSAALEMTTGLEPIVTVDAQEAARRLADDPSEPLVCIISLPEERPFRKDLVTAAVETLSHTPDADVRLVSVGPRAAEVLGETVDRQARGPDGRALPPQIKSWDAVECLRPGAAVGDAQVLARLALHLRAAGVEVRAYSREPLGDLFQALAPAERTALRVFPLSPADALASGGELLGSLRRLAPQLAAGWTTPPTPHQAGTQRPLLCYAPDGGLGGFLPNPANKPFGPGGVSVPTGDGIWVGTARVGRSPQIIISGKGGEVLIRIDVDFSHGEKPHINIQVGKRNEHTDKDGIDLTAKDQITVRVGKGKVVVEVNGQKAGEYEVPEADNQDEIVIERKPDGDVTVTQGGKQVGKVEVRDDGTRVVKIGDKTIEIPPETKPDDGKDDDHGQGDGPEEKPSPKDGKETDDKSKQKTDEGFAHAIILAGPDGRILVCPRGNEGKPPERVPDPVPPGWIVVPGPDGPTIAPDPRGILTDPIPPPPPPCVTYGGSPVPPAPPRGGVYLVDGQSLEVIPAARGRKDLLLREGQRPTSNPIPTLHCPFLIFQDANAKE